MTSTYLSKDFLVFHTEKNKTYSLSINHPGGILNNNYLKLSDVAEPIQKEIYDMTSLKEDEMTFELLSNLKDQIVLIQSPDSSSWSTFYYLQPMKIVNVLEEGLELNKMNPDGEPNYETRQFEGFISWIMTFKEMNNRPHVFNIWLPRKLYFEKIKSFHLQDRILNDQIFQEYKFNPDNIINNQTASELSANVSMYNENKDFQDKI